MQANILPQSVIESWRAAALRSNPTNGHKLLPIEKKSGVLRIAALMSCPRLAWTDTFGCVNEIFLPLGIPLTRHSGVFWGQGLTRLMEEGIERDLDYMITVDYDSIFTREQVIQLIKLMEENEDIDAIIPVQIRRGSNNSMFTIRDGNEFAREVKYEVFEQPLTPISTGHFGLTIIRASSLLKLARPWFLAIPDADGQWGPGHIDEDIYFWLNAECAKWDVRLANEVRIGHIQNVVSWPRADFTPQFQYLKDWNEKGQPNA